MQTRSGSPLGDPGDGARRRALAERRHAEVEVGEMRDAQAVELGRQAVDRQLERPQPHPARFERAVHDDERREREDDPEKGQIWSFSMTGFTETTCRLNFSSASSTPAATPTSCERWRIGILKSRPVAAFSFDCQASSERWQSGHGVTIASAPASYACSIGWISSPSAVSSRAWMIGKPQHLIFAG